MLNQALTLILAVILNGASNLTPSLTLARCARLTAAARRYRRGGGAAQGGPRAVDQQPSGRLRLERRDVLAPAPPPLDEAAIAEVMSLLSRAQRPIIIAGQGAIDCHEALREFARIGNIPVTTTLHGEPPIYLRA